MLTFKKNLLTKSNLLIAYKLLYDALFLTLLTFASALIVEGVLPGMISEHVSMVKIALTIFLIIGAIIWIGNKLDIVYDAPKLKRNKYLPFIIILSFLLIGNSMLHFALWQNIAITLTMLLIFFLFYDLLFSTK